MPVRCLRCCCDTRRLVYLMSEDGRIEENVCTLLSYAKVCCTYEHCTCIHTHTHTPHTHHTHTPHTSHTSDAGLHDLLYQRSGSGFPYKARRLALKVVLHVAPPEVVQRVANKSLNEVM